MTDVQWQRAMKDAQRTKEWFEARKLRITGSRAGAILGLNPNKSYDDVMREMVREYHGAESEFQGNIATRWGQDNETIATRALGFFTGSSVEESGLFVRGWYAASPDGFITVNGNRYVVEIKCPFGLRDKDDPEFKGISSQEQAHYYAQVQLEMKASGLGACIFWQWTPKAQKGLVVKRDHKFIARMMPILHAFYLDLLEEIKKPEKHLEPKRKIINTVESRRLVEQLGELQDQYDLVSEKIADIKKQLVAMAGDKSATVSGLNVTRVEKSGSISWAKVAKATMPDGFDVTPYQGKPSVTWRIG